MQRQQDHIQQQQEHMQQQQEHMQQQQRELIHSINSLKDTTLADISRSQTELQKSQTDLSARLERLERASPDLNPTELRTNPSDGDFVFHAVPTQVTAPLATRPSITSDVEKETETSFRPLTSVSNSLLELNPPPVLERSERIRNRIMMGGIQEEVSEVISPFGRPSRTAHRPHCLELIADCLFHGKHG